MLSQKHQKKHDHTYIQIKLPFKIHHHKKRMKLIILEKVEKIIF